MNKSDLPLRHEKKYQISALDALLLRNRLKSVLKTDPHANSQGTYPVSSLYYDTPEDKALREKLDGVSPREKYRIRTYGTDLSFFKLERKRKLHGLTNKEAKPLTFEEVEFLLEGKIDFLLKKDGHLYQDFYVKIKTEGLKPTKVILYDREAYLFEAGNVRLTLDRHLRIGSPHLFLKENPYFQGLPDANVIFEVKYDAFLPELIQHLIQGPAVSQQAFSKYAHARMVD